MHLVGGREMKISQDLHCTRQIRRIDERVCRRSVFWILDLDKLDAAANGYAATLPATIRQDVRGASILPELLFDEIAADALEYSRVNKAPKSHRADCYLMGIILDWFGGRPALEVTSQDIADRLAELAGDGRKPATCQQYRSLLSATFSRAMQSGKLENNPVRDVALQGAISGRIRFLKPDEEAKLRAKIRETAPSRESEFDLALQTGMRRGEQYSLTWGDVDLDLGVLQIPHSKNGAPRRVFLNSTARAAVERLLELNDRTDLVCPAPGRWFERAVQLAGIPDFRWHDLRHTFASRLVMAGVDLRSVQELLGHKSFAITLRYVHLAQNHLHGAVEQLCRMDKSETPA